MASLLNRLNFEAAYGNWILSLLLCNLGITVCNKRPLSRTQKHSSQSSQLRHATCLAEIFCAIPRTCFSYWQLSTHAVYGHICIYALSSLVHITWLFNALTAILQTQGSMDIGVACNIVFFCFVVCCTYFEMKTWNTYIIDHHRKLCNLLIQINKYFFTLYWFCLFQFFCV